MNQLTPIAGLLSRFYLAIFFLAHVAQYKYWPHPEWLAKAFPSHFHGSVGWQDEAAALLLFIIALWLIAGIRSRIVGLIGFVLCTGSVVLRHDAPMEAFLTLAWSPDRLIALAAVVTLAFVGGGKWRLFPGGWNFRNVT
ncbi:MAG: Protein of unknown function (DUF2754) [Rhodobacteraceae bacterium HLUCCO07]|nr:MAG: Protein of unknown function (DUF2754) [Rhodobacteraceae bacterium HLUCCO07]